MSIFCNNEGAELVTPLKVGLAPSAEISIFITTTGFPLPQQGYGTVVLGNTWAAFLPASPAGTLDPYSKLRRMGQKEHAILPTVWMGNVGTGLLIAKKRLLR